MARLLLFVAGLIVYGSLFPFNFQTTVVGGEALAALWPPQPLSMSRGDVLANTVPFLPLGMIVALIVGQARVGWGLLLLALAATWMLAISLQLAQILLPVRIAALNDAVWNGVGIAIGGVIGALMAKRGLLSQSQRDTIISAPTILIVTWVGLKLMPLIPTLEMADIRASLLPLVGEPDLALGEIAIHCVGWLIAFYLWRQLDSRPRRDQWLFAYVGLVFAAEIVIADNLLTASEVLGAVFALSLWWGVLRHSDGPPRALTVALIAILAFRGLAPFTPRSEPAVFLWLPLTGAMVGNVITGMTAVLGKTFLYGGLVWLLHEADNSWRRAAAVSAILLAAIEIAQLLFAGHTPETTDPVLAMLLAAVFHGLDPDRLDDDTPIVGGRRPLARKSWYPSRHGRTLDA